MTALCNKSARALFAGEETYDALKLMLGGLRDLFKTKVALSDDLLEGLSDSAAAAPAACAGELAVEWIMSSDHKLVTMVLGHGGAGCSCACPFCEWVRAEARRVHVARTTEGMARMAHLATTYVKPLSAAIQEVRSRWQDCN